MFKINNYYKYFFLLAVFLCSLFLVNIGSYPLDTPDGARYSEIPREMLASNDYVTPHLNGVKYFEKPPLFYWMQALSLKILGNDELGANLVNAVMGLLACFLMYFANSRIFGSLQGLLSSLVLGTSALFFILARVVTLDMALTAFLTGALLFFLLANQKVSRVVQRNYLWLMYTCAALATMTKGLIGILFPGAIILIWVMICNQWKMVKNCCIPSGVIIFLLITLPWHILVQVRNPEFFHFYFVEQHFLRYLTSYAGRSQPWWFLPAIFIGGFLPWIFWLPQAIRFNFPVNFWKNRQQNKNSLFFIIWAVFIYLFFTFSNSQLLPYLLPMFPAIATLVGTYFAANWHLLKNKVSAFGLSYISLVLFCVVLGVASYILIFKIKISLGAISLKIIYTAFILLFSGALIATVSYWRCGVSRSVTVLMISSSLVLFSISPVLTIANNHSIKNLAIILKPKLTPNTEVVCYQTYYQDLPFYLDRIVTIVDYKNELAYGLSHQPLARDWMITSKQLWQKWDGEKKMFMVIDAEKYKSLQKNYSHNFFVIATENKEVLVTNKLGK